MLKLVELIILAAAIDGRIDEREQTTILRILTQNKRTPQLSNAQLAGVQAQLIHRFEQGETRESVITQAASTLEESDLYLVYAIAVEVVMADGRLTTSEANFLRQQRTMFELDPEKVEKIHFSAQLRYGFGSLD